MSEASKDILAGMRRSNEAAYSGGVARAQGLGLEGVPSSLRPADAIPISPEPETGRSRKERLEGAKKVGKWLKDTFWTKEDMRANLLTGGAIALVRAGLNWGTGGLGLAASVGVGAVAGGARAGIQEVYREFGKQTERTKQRIEEDSPSLEGPHPADIQELVEAKDTKFLELGKRFRSLDRESRGKVVKAAARGAAYGALGAAIGFEIKELGIPGIIKEKLAEHLERFGTERVVGMGITSALGGALVGVTDKWISFLRTGNRKDLFNKKTAYQAIVGGLIGTTLGELFLADRGTPEVYFNPSDAAATATAVAQETVILPSGLPTEVPAVEATSTSTPSPAVRPAVSPVASPEVPRAVASPEPSATTTPGPTLAPTPAPTETATPVVVPTEIPIATPIATAIAVETPVPTSTSVPTETLTAEPTNTSLSTETPVSPTSTPTLAETPKPTPTLTETSTAVPSSTIPPAASTPDALPSGSADVVSELQSKIDQGQVRIGPDVNQLIDRNELSKPEIQSLFTGKTAVADLSSEYGSPDVKSPLGPNLSSLKGKIDAYVGEYLMANRLSDPEFSDFIKTLDRSNFYNPDFINELQSGASIKFDPFNNADHLLLLQKFQAERPDMYKKLLGTTYAFIKLNSTDNVFSNSNPDFFDNTKAGSLLRPADMNSFFNTIRGK